MSYLVDACALIVFLGDPNADAVMPTGARAIRDEDVAVLPVTVWEIARKASSGKLPKFWGPELSLTDLLAELGFRRYQTTWEDAEAAADLPDLHRDPMDRILIATALRADLTVITSDRIFRSYNVKTVW